MFAIRGAWSKFFGTDGFFLSAGLAFFFLVTMIPLVMLGISALGFVLTSQQAATAVVDQLTRNFPVYKREIRGVLLRIVETRAVSGGLGTIILIMFSTPLFSSSRLVLHRMLGIRASTGVVHNFLLDSGMVMIFSALLFGATVATWLFHWLELFVLEPMELSRAWIHGANIGFSIVLSGAMFYLGYRYVPRRHVRVGAALPGAIVASLLWEVAKQLFSLYIRKVGIYDQIYGPLGVLVAFIMFVYYSAVVFVFGGAYVAALESRRR